MAVFTAPLVSDTGISADDLDAHRYYLGSFVVPGYQEELLVEASATAGKVVVNTGAGVCAGKFYTNTADVVLSIDAAANNRIDLIVLRRSDANRTVRATVIKGTAAANPSPPAYTVFDFPLAWIWVPSGFNPAVNTIAAVDVHDERLFSQLGVETTVAGTAYRSSGSLENLMHNTEFIAYSGHAVGSVAPEGWRITAAAPTSILGAAKLSSQIRGRSIRIQAAAGRGMQTQLRVANGVYTIKGSLSITSGSARVSVGGVNYDFKRTGVVTTFIIRAVVTTNEIPLIITANSAGSDLYVGQLMVVQGYVPGHFRNKHEIIFLDYPLADAAWTATAKSTGTTAIDMTASFAAMLTTGTPVRGLLARLRANDSGSALNSGNLYIVSAVSIALSSCSLVGIDDDKVREATAFIPMDGGIGTSFTLGVFASGAGTLDATVEIIGVIT